jgi:hypothetical protein
LEVGDDVDIRFGFDNRRDFECLEDRGDLGVATDVDLGIGIGDSLDDVGDLSCVESKGDSTVLDGQSIWGLTRSSQGIPRMIE